VNLLDYVSMSVRGHERVRDFDGFLTYRLLKGFSVYSSLSRVTRPYRGLHQYYKVVSSGIKWERSTMNKVNRGTY
jgi:hypothetical protein